MEYGSWVVTVFQDNGTAPEISKLVAEWSWLCKTKELAVNKAEELAKNNPTHHVRYGRYTNKIKYNSPDPFTRIELEPR